MGKTHFKTLIDSDWLGQWDLPAGKDVIVVIESVNRYVPEQKRRKRDPRTGQMRDEPSRRLDIGFKGKRKHWLSGPVTQATIAKMYGRYIEDWIGKPIALYVDSSVMMGKEQTGGIRVRPTPPGRSQAPTEDPLDNPVDDAKREQIDEAIEHTEGTPRTREPGEDDE